ncbi:response regulator transcription factor [Mucilaginibacter arboris]|uniref:Response regulator n=1 Tax=Mucilaginibacter arboris TaxID=2682090 RepID=A0A7K1SVK6_9SPHI|nr:response regulator [Mucilaginibacter arboris]MVN21080.1 response regulator [Mucilaginibacter arboris]
MKHILIVDDNAPICEVMSDILEMEGYQTTVRMTGKDAILFIKKLHPDLILLDVMLDNGIDGRDICRDIKQSTTEVKNIPVIMVSASHNLQDSLNNFCHPDGFISKPFDIFHLVDTVNKQFKC